MACCSLKPRMASYTRNGSTINTVPGSPTVVLSPLTKRHLMDTTGDEPGLVGSTYIVLLFTVVKSAAGKCIYPTIEYPLYLLPVCPGITIWMCSWVVYFVCRNVIDLTLQRRILSGIYVLWFEIIGEYK